MGGRGGGTLKRRCLDALGHRTAGVFGRGNGSRAHLGAVSSSQAEIRFAFPTIPLRSKTVCRLAVGPH